MEPITLRSEAAHRTHAWISMLIKYERDFITFPGDSYYDRTVQIASTSSLLPAIAVADATGLLTLHEGQQLGDTGLLYCRNNHIPIRREAQTLPMSPIDIERWTLAAPLFRDHPGQRPRFQPFEETEWRDWPLLTRAEDYRFGLMLVIASALYGSFHMLAWTAPFHTRTEKLLWQISASIIAGYGIAVHFIFLLLNISSHLSYRLTKLFREAIQERIYGPLAVCYPPTLLILLLTLSYTFARVYLIVECFINLAHLSSEAYTQPSWATYVPHIG
jgi:hypothetical protein